MFGPLRLHPWLERLLARTRVSLDDPFVLVRLAVGFLLGFGTLVGLGFWLAAGDSRFLQLALGIWAVYGIVTGIVSGMLDPLVDGLARAIPDAGLERGGAGYSSIETLVVRGHVAQAAEEYRLRAQDLQVGMALVGLYDQRLHDPGRAMVELSRLVELYAGSPRGAELRHRLRALKREQFGDPPSSDGGP
jgi:hypothetical protein